MSLDVENKQREAARLLEKEIDGAANNEEGSFFTINNAVGLIIDAAVEKARARIEEEGLPEVEGLRGQIESLRKEIACVNDHISAIWKALNALVDRAEIRPDVPPAAPLEWEVYLTYLDINNNPTGNEARIGLYAAQDDAGHVAQLLNKLTSSAYNFDHRQV